MRYGWVATRGDKFVGACMNELTPEGGQVFRVRRWLSDMADRPGMFIHACNTQAQLATVQGRYPQHVPQDRPRESPGHWGRS